jgi:hypothetical protein
MQGELRKLLSHDTEPLPTMASAVVPAGVSITMRQQALLPNFVSDIVQRARPVANSRQPMRLFQRIQQHLPALWPQTELRFMRSSAGSAKSTGESTLPVAEQTRVL